MKWYTEAELVSSTRSNGTDKWQEMKAVHIGIDGVYMYLWNRNDTMLGKWVLGLVQSTKIDKISPKKEDLTSCLNSRLGSLKSCILRKIPPMSPKRREKSCVMRNQNPGNLLTLKRSIDRKSSYFVWHNARVILTHQNHQLSRVIRLIG